MKDHLKQHINLLFVDATGADDIKQEILQNTLDRYDDLIAQGKTPEAAYQLAISGIGDVSELLGSRATHPHRPAQTQQSAGKPIWKRILFAIAIFLYIVAIIPLVVLGSMNMAVFGFCGTLAIVAIATPLVIIASGGEKTAQHFDMDTSEKKPASKVRHWIWAIGVIVYFVLSLLTSAWHITWIIFCILPCLTGIWSGILAYRSSKVNALIKIILLSALVAVLILILTLGLRGKGFSLGFTEFDGLPGGTEASSAQVDDKTVKSIDIRWIGGRIIINRDNAAQAITFCEERDANEPSLAYRVDGDKLTIAYKKEANWSFGINTNLDDKTLIITVPAFWGHEQLEINAISAEIEITDAAGEALDIVTVSGDVTVSGAINSVEIETVSGDVAFNGPFQDLSAETVSGDCEITTAIAVRAVEFESVSGDLRLNVPEDMGFFLSHDSVSGDLITDIPITSAKGRKTYGNGECAISTDTVSGEVYIYHNK